MGKRSNFRRKEMDFYPTPLEAVLPLLPHLPSMYYFNEPCAGDGELVMHLQHHGGICEFAGDVFPQKKHPIGQEIFVHDALSATMAVYDTADYIITNPPWDRKILHPMIDHFRNLAPTWLLFDADWMHTKQSAEFIPYCHKIVSVGRVKWMPDSKMTGKDNCAWYLFDKDKSKTVFYGRKET